MKVPLSWLGEYVDIKLAPEDLAGRLTLAGLEVASIDHIGDWWDREKLVVGEVREVRPHPNADRLVLVDVAYGSTEVEECVTGAPNLFPFKGQGRVSLKVAFAMEGAELYDGHKEGFVKTRLKPTRIRGVPSRAMVCSEKELGISDEHEGIMFLPQDAPVGMPLADYLGDTVFDLDLTPNLARCHSMIGVAREVAALTCESLRYPDTAWKAAGPPATQLARVRIDDPNLCARYIATIIRDVQIGPSPQWLQERVRKAGMRPISNIVDITNYVMLEWGQPLHAFDYEKLLARTGGGVPTIIVRRAMPGETMMTLDGVDRTFSEDTLLICDTAGPIAVAGVMGGFDTEIDDTTRHILLESANFDLVSIRRTTQALKLPSEASLRFGKGIHPSLAEPSVRRATELMRTLAAGTIAQGLIDTYPTQRGAVVIGLSTSDVQRSLGISFSVTAIKALLESLEFRCRESGDDRLAVMVPPHRLDCQYAADLIEEVARIYGYDRIPTTELADRLPPQRANRGLELEETVRDVLASCGLQEMITYSLTSLSLEAALDPARSEQDLSEDSYVVITNPVSQERRVMRRTLLSTGLEAASANLRFRDRLCAFEIGKVFLQEPGAELPGEPRHLSVIMVGPREDRHWLEFGAPDFDFFDLKGVIETLLERLHITDAAYEAGNHPTFREGRTARVRVGAEQIGVVGEVRASVRKAFDLPDRSIFAAELDLGAILAKVPETWYVQSISTYPAVLQDLAVVVDEQLPSAQVQALVTEAGGFLLKEVRPFDVYQGDPIPPGKKSLAFALTFQAPDKTLRDVVVAKQVERIADRLRRELGAELRA